MSDLILAKVDRSRIWTLLPLMPLLFLPQIVRPAWDPHLDGFEMGIWVFWIILVLTLVGDRLRPLVMARRNAGSSLWIADHAVQNLFWKEPIPLAAIADVRVSRSFGQPATVMLVLRDGCIREISSAALNASAPEIAARIRMALAPG